MNNSLFGVNVDLQPLLKKTTEFTEQFKVLITLIEEQTKIQTQILTLLQEKKN